MGVRGGGAVYHLASTDMIYIRDTANQYDIYIQYLS